MSDQPDGALAESLDSGPSPLPRERILSGVHFAPMSGAGPTGMRPEHLKEMVGIRMRRCANRFLKSVGEFAVQAAGGSLGAHARWILDSRLVYIKKKKGVTPRPIRVGETWRRFIGKKLVHTFKDEIQNICTESRQFGVGTPGGAEALIHLRTAIESILTSHAGAPLVMIDIDFKNAFPSIEWKDIRKATEDLLPSLSSWTRWCHLTKSRIFLPCGEVYETDRGSEQGDPIGPFQCAAVIIELMKKVRLRLGSSVPFSTLGTWTMAKYSAAHVMQTHSSKPLTLRRS